MACCWLLLRFEDAKAVAAIQRGENGINAIYSEQGVCKNYLEI